jgi:hypothetical protein
LVRSFVRSLVGWLVGWLCVRSKRPPLQLLCAFCGS